MPASGPRLSTRVLLLCGAFAAVHMLLHLATVPVLTVLAPFSPPAYGLVAGVHGLMPFLARRFTATPGTATITAGIAGVFVALASPSGFLVLVPLLVAGIVIDAVVWRVDHGGRASRRVTVRYLLAAVLAGTALFAVSLSVFSPEHLTPLLLVSTLGARIAGELIAVTLAGVLVRALERAGVRRPGECASRNAPRTG
ncbi:MAG: hypothetical protein ACQEW8_05600 [Actinomycetota bacterium]